MADSGSDERKRRLIDGLKFLRQHALDAHRAGDGLLVSHCCSVALQRCVDFGKANPSNKVNLTAVWWAFILGMYWMTYDLFLHLVESAFKEVIDSETDATDKEFAVIIYNRLCGGFEGINPETAKTIPADWWNTQGINPTEEHIVGFSFAVELIWIYAPEEAAWRTFYSKWTEQAELNNTLFVRMEQLRNRLEFQSRLFKGQVFGATTSDIVCISDSVQQELFSGWNALYNCDWETLSATLERVKYRVRVTDPAYIPLYNLLQHSLTWRKHSEPQTVTQSRRQLARSRQPSEALRLQRDAFASSRFLKVATAGFPTNDMGYERRSCIRLSTLLQLNALRTWDVGGWLEGLQWRAACFLELAVTERNANFLLHGIIDAVRSHSVPDPKKQPRFAIALKMLDGLNNEQREGLVAELLNSPPIEWRAAYTLLKHLSDAIPPKLHKEVAKWSVSVEKTDLLRNHWKHTFLDLWEKILPYAPERSDLVEILAPILRGAIAISTRWHELHDTFIGAILAAAKPLAKDLLDILLQADCKEHDWNEYRFSIGYNVLLRRPDLHANLFIFLIGDAQTRNNRQQTQLLRQYEREKKGNTQRADSDFRDEIISSVLQHIDERWNITEKSFTIGVRQFYQDARLIDWPRPHSQLVDRLIAAIEAETVLLMDKFNYVALLTVLLEKGPQPQANRITRRSLRWLHNGITGRQLLSRIGGPLSLSQVNLNEVGNLRNAQLQLLGASVLRCPELIHDEVVNWLVVRAAELSLLEPYYVLQICLGAIAGVEASNNQETAILVGIADTVATVSGIENAAKIAMAFLSVVFQEKQPEFAALATLSHQWTDIFFRQWVRRLQRYATFADLEVRQVTANIVQRWIDASFPFAVDLSTTRDLLNTDCRLRVRAALSELESEVVVG